MSPEPFAPFETLPAELIEGILLFCEVSDVASFARTCRSARRLIYQSEDQYFWRELFLQKPFDDLRKATPPLLAQAPSVQPDWKSELQCRIAAEHVLAAEVTGPPLRDALETLVGAVETALPLSDGPDVEYSENLRWLEGLLRHTKFDADAMSAEERQLLGRLMTYYALTYDSPRDPNGENPAVRKRFNEMRRTSRCYVYDLRRYKEDTLWGPFMRGEKGELRTDWVHMEHVVNVVAMKLRELPSLALQLYSKPRAGLSATQAYSAPFAHERKPHDWAGVSGTWRRFVCFMDYRDLFAFNFSASGSGPRDRNFFDDDYQEAIRPVELQLRVLDPQPSGSSQTPSSDMNSPAPHPSRYPPLFFKGLSRGAHSADAVVEGSVRVLADGSIRWSFVTKYDGLTQWSAEGIQIGNLCSAAGVAGIWTGAFHEDADPAGPFWMWKVPEELPEGL